jgi:hypothetical protein
MKTIIQRIFVVSVMTIFLMSCGSNVSQEDKEMSDEIFSISIDLINTENYESAIDTLNFLINRQLFLNKAKLLKSGCLLALNKTHEAWDVFESRLSSVSKTTVNYEVNKWPIPPPKTVSSSFFIMLNKEKKICNTILSLELNDDIPIIKKIRDEAIKSYEVNSKKP